MSSHTEGTLVTYILTIAPPDGVRRAHINQLMQGLELDHQFVEGFSRSDTSIWQSYDRLRNLLLRKRSLTGSEAAIYCGHRKIWREFIDSNAEFALICEDDMDVSDKATFLAAVAAGKNNANSWDLIKFFDFDASAVAGSRRFDDVEFVKLSKGSTGAVCYLISRAAAQRMLSRVRFFRAIDEEFLWPWEFDLRIWSVHPSPVRESSHILGGSLREPHVERVFALRKFVSNIVQMYRKLRYRYYLRSY